MTRFLLALAGALTFAGAAQAAERSYVVRTFTEPASRGLAVSKPLAEFVATSRARAIVPRSWRAVGTTQLQTPSDGSCSYRVKLTVRTRVDAPGDAAARVRAALPASGRYVLDEGERRRGAFRVVRRPGGEGVHLDAQWSGVLTRRDDIVPQGRVVWTDLSVSAQSRPGDECHSGTYRDVLGPQIADALATARMDLRFARA